MVNGYSPTSLKEALEILSQQHSIPYAGGTDLMVGDDSSRTFLFLNKVTELKSITTEDGYVKIGSGCTFTDVLNNSFVPKVMKAAVKQIAAPAIRNLGTMGGNIGNGSAKADTVVVHFAADSKVRVASLRGERIIDIDKFYLGRKKLDLASDELIVEILMPIEGLENYYFQKVAERLALAISRVSFAGIFSMENGHISNISAAFGAVADKVLRFKNIEAMMLGKTLDEARSLKEEYMRAYSSAMTLTKGRVSAEFRKDVCLNLLRDFLSQNGI
jgi:CO/xanthine dehydrogenase FAD-binding subunit